MSLIEEAGDAKIRAWLAPEGSSALCFPEGLPEDERRISGAIFLELLQAPRWAASRDGLRLTNAVIATPVHGRYAQVAGELCFRGCHFLEAVDLPYAKFSRRVRFLGCTFEKGIALEYAQMPEIWLGDPDDGGPIDAKGTANLTNIVIDGRLACDGALFADEHGEALFTGAAVGGDLSLEHATFHGRVDLHSAQIRGQLLCDQAEFRSAEATIMLNCVHVGGIASFEGARFKGPVDFGNAHMQAQLCFDEAQCASAHEDVNFNGITVKGLASFEKAQFSGPVDFRGAEVSGYFICDSAQFLSPDHEADFNGMKVHGLASFEKARFCGGVDFGTAEIHGHVLFDEAEFIHSKKESNFNRMTVKDTASFEKAVFRGPADFGGALIGGDCIFDQSRFMSETEEASFVGIRVARYLSFEEAQFQGPFGLAYGEVGGQLICNRARFEDESSEVNCEGVQVKGDAHFEGVIFGGAMSLASADIAGQLICANAQFQSKKEGVDCFGLTVGDSAIFRGTRFLGPFDFSHCTCAKNLEFAGAQFDKRLNLSKTKVLGALYLFSVPTRAHDEGAQDTRLPKEGDLRGLSYDRVDLHGLAEWKQWVSLKPATDAYDPGPYLTLERWYRRSGRDEVADEVHFEMRVAEAEYFRSQLGSKGVRRKLLWNWFLRVTVGYGVCGHRLVWWALGIPMVGICLAWIGDNFGFIQVDKEKWETCSAFSALAYGLDVLLPGADLGYKDCWHPNGTGVALAQLSLRLIWGAIIPLAVAQFAGLFKKKE